MAEYRLADQFVTKIKKRYPDAEILAGLPIGWVGWELDHEAAVISTGGRVLLVGTDHGVLVPRHPQFLRDCLATYGEWIRLTEAAMALLPDTDR